MSSAILYVAIVAIWAGVLIPRWLRRDSSPPAEAQADEPENAADSVTSAPPSGRRDDGEDTARERHPEPDEDEGEDAGMAGDPARRRVLSARRRLLLMLLALTAAAAALACTRMAAWWVIVPPTVMLFGYLMLLREAARADTERRELARARMYEAAARDSRAVVPAGVPQAEVIDFSAPKGRHDEIYDQYEEAKLRAVGD